MKILSPSFEILSIQPGNDILELIELAGRTCYKSENSITQESSYKFVKSLIDSGHHSVIEHSLVTVKIICDRGISHEIVRHRLASYSQESTRYANYSRNKFGKEISVIKPSYFSANSTKFNIWKSAMESAERAYMQLLEKGAKAEEARSVLPNSLKTEIVVSANIREWRHIFKLRTSKAAHPQIREIMIPLVVDLGEKVPVLFDDIIQQIYQGKGE